MFLQTTSDTSMNSLEPEVAKNVEFGLNIARNDVIATGDSLFVKLAYFDNLTENYIARIGGNSVNYNFYNIDSVRFKGIELSGRYETAAVFAEASLTYYTDAEYCMPTFDPGPTFCDDYVKGADYSAPYIPPEWAGSVTLGTRMFEDRLTLGGRLDFAGRKLSLVRHNFINDTQWDPYLVVNLFGSYKFSDTVTLDFSAENLFDLYYVDALSRTQMPSPGRTIRTSLTATF
jgi:hemoglobin/transferrin/lactoferrin receptor protein